MGFNLKNAISGALSGAVSGGAMSGPWGALAGAVGGGAMSGFSEEPNSAKESYKYSLALQKQNQKWQTEMSNTSHQREVKDLEAAGLNPVLSAMGNGASTGTPGGGTVTAEPNAAKKMAKIAEQNAFMEKAITLKSLQNATAKTQADVANTNADTELKTPMAMAEIALKGAQAGNAKAQQTYTNIMKIVDKELKQAETKNKRADTVQKVSNLIGTEETETRIPWFFTHKSKRATNSAKQVQELMRSL